MARTRRCRRLAGRTDESIQVILAYLGLPRRNTNTRQDSEGRSLAILQFFLVETKVARVWKLYIVVFTASSILVLCKGKNGKKVQGRRSPKSAPTSTSGQLDHGDMGCPSALVSDSHSTKSTAAVCG